jgi:hypothetical protein
MDRISLNIEYQTLHLQKNKKKGNSLLRIKGSKRIIGGKTSGSNKACVQDAAS